MSGCSTENNQALEVNLSDMEQTDFAPISITGGAGKFIASFIEKNKEERFAAFRLSVSKGGCSGKSYLVEPLTGEQVADLDAQQDAIFTENGATVVVAKKYASDLSGVEIDYVEHGLMGGTLKINNPNAKSSCGCGKSYN
jgi:iron-sulfur cluster assembly protein